MPNWCENRLIVRGDAGLIKDFLTRSKDKDGKFTLNGLVPMPDELNITSGTQVDNARDVILSGKKNWSGIDAKLSLPAWVKDAGIKYSDSMKKKRTKMRNYMKSKLSDEDMRMGQQSFGNEVKYGAKNWYDWHLANWGTKWDVNAIVDELSEDDVEITFDSAWAPPILWLEKVELLFPDLSFQLHYDEPGMGFKGVYSGGSNQCINY